MVDSVYINDLKVETLIGVYDFERIAQQVLFLSFEMDYDCLRAGQTDDLQHALDYDRLSKVIRTWADKQTFNLLEAFAEQLCQLIHEEFSILRIKLRINKPAAVTDCAAVGICIERKYGL